MNKLTIRQLFFSLIAITTIMATLYISINYIYMKQSVEKSLELQSINDAYYVSKKLTQMNDNLAYRYSLHEHEMFESLKKVQNYLKTHGSMAKLDALKTTLENSREEIIYHIYIIDKNFTIKNTTFKPDLNLDFHIIPEALKTMKYTYKHLNYIDLSSLRHDAVANDYKKYILQRQKKEDYLVQLSLTIKENKKTFTQEISKKIPNLLNSKIYLIFSPDNKYENIDLIWSNQYSKMDKSQRLLSRDVNEEFIPHFNMQGDVNAHNVKEKVFEFAQNEKYKDEYFYKDDRYIHRIMMPFYSYLNTDEETIHILALEFDETQAKQTIKNLQTINILVWIFIFLIILIIILSIHHRFIKPISLLQSKMKSKELVKKGSIPKYKDEITSIIFIYNQLLIDLKREILANEELLEQFKIFTGNAIHQVRTPISVIKIALEMIETKNKDAILQIQSSLVSMEHLYDTLAYGLQKDSIEFKPQKLNLSTLLESRIKMFHPVILAHDITLTLNIAPHLYIEMNPTEAEYLIDNNISNAIKYNDSHKKIQITLSSMQNEILFSVENSAKPIEDTELIFERYHRSDTSRKGSGIGLHMVKNICMKYSIIIDVQYFNGYNKFIYYLTKM